MRNVKKGFTLIELLAAVLVIGILSSIAMPKYRKSVERARATEGLVMLPALYDSMLRWQAENPEKQWSTNGSFEQLDISSKGTVSGSGSASKLCTPNFIYNYYPKDDISHVTNILVATVRKGPYKGNFFVYSPMHTNEESAPGDAHIYCAPRFGEGFSNICGLMGYKLTEFGSLADVPADLLQFMHMHRVKLTNPFYNCD